MTSGVYTITNRLNGRVYFGESVDIYRRLSQHFSSLREGSHHNVLLQRSWEKHTPQDFIGEPLHFCPKVCAITLEWILIDIASPREVYNIRIGSIPYSSKQSTRHIPKLSPGDFTLGERLRRLSQVQIPSTSTIRSQVSRRLSQLQSLKIRR